MNNLILIRKLYEFIYKFLKNVINECNYSTLKMPSKFNFCFHYYILQMLLVVF